MATADERVAEATEREAEATMVARDYQIEIFEEACKQNVIVCLGTGTGKTFISVMLIKQLAHEIRGKFQDGGRRTFFLVTTVPLVHQQSKAIESQTGLIVGKYTGDMNVDAWDKETWRDEFNKHEVLVMTHQILLNNFLHDFIRPSNINLLILDECHHTNKSHPYMGIMNLIEKSTHQPRVMGLTASIINEKVKKRGVLLQIYLENRMRELEASLRAVCFTCADQSTILPYATKPIESVEVYQPFVTNKREIQKINQLMQEALAAVPPRATSKEQKQSRQKSMEILKDLNEILSSLGIWCTYKAALDLKKNLGTGFSRESDRVIAMNAVREVISTFEAHNAKQYFGDQIIAPKVFKLMNLLVENNQEKDLCCIVFVRRRVTTKVLSDLVNLLAETSNDYSGIRSDFVHGHSLLEIIRGADHGGMTSSNQEKILKRFREGEFNVLIATSVVEEGLDVRKCNLVIRFDGVDNYREYVQSKGRARASQSKFIVLAEQSMVHEVISGIEEMKEVENFLIEKSRGRDLPTEEEIEEYNNKEAPIEPYRISSEEGAAQISHRNAVPLLFMYCSMLPSDRFTKLVPTFMYRSENGDISAVVTMPLNSPLREEVIGDPMPTRKLARVSAAQKACIRLHNIGELDDNFVPISRNDASEDEEDDDDYGTTDGGNGKKTVRHIYERKIPDCLATDNGFLSSTLYLYSLEISLVSPADTKHALALSNLWYHEERHSFGLLTAKRLPEVPCFPLYTKAGKANVQVKLLQSELSLEERDVKEAANFHHEIFQQYIQKYDPECEFSFHDAASKAILVAVKDSTYNSSKRKKECLVDFAFMDKICNVRVGSSGDLGYEDAVVKETYTDRNSLFYVTAVRRDMKTSDKIAPNQPTFKDYYKSKYGKDISSGQPLLECVHASSRVNLINPKYTEESVKQQKGSSKSHTGELHLIPELCEKLRIPASFHCQLVCIPSLLFRLETILAAEELRKRMAEGIRESISVDSSDEEFMSADECEDDNGYTHRDSPVTYNKELSALMRKPMERSQGKSHQSSGINEICGKMESFLKGRGDGGSTAIELQVILQSLTTCKAHAGFDLERLETLGDSFLKAATSVYLYFKHPNKDEGRLTEKRKRLVSNKKLLKLAKEKKIPQFICNTEFGLKSNNTEEDGNATLWIPPMFIKRSGDSIVKACQIVRDKSIADCVEAFIGAFFEHGGIKNALDIMKWFGLGCFYKDLDHKPNAVRSQQSENAYADFIPPTTALLVEGDEASAFVQEQYENVKLALLEERIKYTFREKSFLIQAFTHMSYYRNRSTDCYQRLEFLGDALLDFLVIAHLYACGKQLDPSSLTIIKSALVNNNTFALLAVRYKLHKYLMHFEQKIHSAISEFIILDENMIDEQLKNPFIITLDGNANEGFHAPKILGDIFESLAGAIFLDSGLDLVKVWKVFYPIMQPLIDQYIKDTPSHPVTKLCELYPTSSASCQKGKDGKMLCTWNVDGHNYEGVGQNKDMAKATAALNALSKLKISTERN